MDNQPPKAFIFMKVGPYGDECLNCILERKQRELKGPEKKIFWGYGGPGLLDPKRVQCFVRESGKRQGSIKLLMQKTYSHHNPEQVNASLAKRKYSVDGKKWKCIPPGIVTDSSYALVLGEIKPVHLELDRQKFKVGIGPSKGCNAAKYGGRDRFDKVCLVAAEPTYDVLDQPKLIIEFQAKLVCPYAVFLR